MSMKHFLLCLLFASGSSSAQVVNVPDAPTPSVVQATAKRIAAPTRVRFALETTDGLLRGLDTYTSHKLFSDPCHCYHELDPLAPNTGNVAALAAFQSAAGFAVIQGSRWLERRGHPRWARSLLIADIVSEGYAVGNNFAVGRMQH